MLMEKVMPEESFAEGKGKSPGKPSVKDREGGKTRESGAIAHAKEQRQETEGVLGVASFADLWRVRPRVRGNQTGRRKVTGEVGISPSK